MTDLQLSMPSLFNTDKCENEFQKQMKSTEGHLFYYYSEEFSGIPLTVPSFAAQSILTFFSNHGCPFSNLRLAESLSTLNLECWPLKSNSLSRRYLLLGYELLVAIQSEPLVTQKLNLFEQAAESKRFASLAVELIGLDNLRERVDSEITKYILKNHTISIQPKFRFDFS